MGNTDGVPVFPNAIIFPALFTGISSKISTQKLVKSLRAVSQSFRRSTYSQYIQNSKMAQRM